MQPTKFRVYLDLTDQTGLQINSYQIKFIVLNC
jgi:hypothetical protein